jgi:hypothetical protein
VRYVLRKRSWRETLMARDRGKGAIRGKARELERRYLEGYRKKPEDTAWGEMGLQLLAARLPREKRERSSRPRLDLPPRA